MLGGVIWLTGLSGVGKTTISRILLENLRKRDIANSVLVDGDMIRDCIQDQNVGHDRESRLLNAYRICRFVRMLERQGMNVIVATMSLYHEIHEWNRLQFSNYLEVHLKASLETLKARDQKGLYSRYSAGEQSDVVGLDLKAEEPLQPHMTFNNDGDQNSLVAIAQKIEEKILWLS